MDLVSFLLLLLIAALCGAAGQALAGYSHGGCLVSTVLGLIGAYVGVWLAGELGLPTFLTVNVGAQPFPVVWAVLGAALLALAFGLIRRMSARV